MEALPDNSQFREPWHPTAQPLHEELSREISQAHVLYSVRARAIARRQDCDDVLFELSGENAPAAFAVVHLTWSGRPDAYPQFPWTQLYATFSDWTESCMTPDADEWRLGEGSSA